MCRKSRIIAEPDRFGRGKKQPASATEQKRENQRDLHNNAGPDSGARELAPLVAIQAARRLGGFSILLASSSTASTGDALDVNQFAAEPEPDSSTEHPDNAVGRNCLPYSATVVACTRAQTSAIWVH